MKKLRKNWVDQLGFSEASLINTSQETTKYRTRHITLLSCRVKSTQGMKQPWEMFSTQARYFWSFVIHIVKSVAANRYKWLRYSDKSCIETMKNIECHNFRRAIQTIRCTRDRIDPKCKLFRWKVSRDRKSAEISTRFLWFGGCDTRKTQWNGGFVRWYCPRTLSDRLPRWKNACTQRRRSLPICSK